MLPIGLKAMLNANPMRQYMWFEDRRLDKEFSDSASENNIDEWRHDGGL